MINQKTSYSTNSFEVLYGQYAYHVPSKPIYRHGFFDWFGNLKLDQVN